MALVTKTMAEVWERACGGVGAPDAGFLWGLTWISEAGEWGEAGTFTAERRSLAAALECGVEELDAALDRLRKRGKIRVVQTCEQVVTVTVGLYTDGWARARARKRVNERLRRELAKKTARRLARGKAVRV